MQKIIGLKWVLPGDPCGVGAGWEKEGIVVGVMGLVPEVFISVDDLLIARQIRRNGKLERSDEP